MISHHIPVEFVSFYYHTSANKCNISHMYRQKRLTLKNGIIDMCGFGDTISISSKGNELIIILIPSSDQMDVVLIRLLTKDT